VSDEASAMIIMIRNLPSSSFPHCPIYTAFASLTPQTNTGAFPIIHTHNHTVSFRPLFLSKKKKVNPSFFSPSSLAAFSDLDFFSFLPRFHPQFCRQPSNRPGLRLGLRFLRCPVPILALSVNGIRF